MFAQFFALASVLMTLTTPVTATPTGSATWAHSKGAETFTGRATYYDTGLGACGWTNVDTDMIVALNHVQYEATTPRGADCGKWVKITNNKTGNVAHAYVADLCPGCAKGSLDMSPSLFSQLNNGDLDAGVFPITWYFTGRNETTTKTLTAESDVETDDDEVRE